MTASAPASLHVLLVEDRTLADQLAARWPGVRVLYMSGYTDDAIVRHGMLEPGLAYLQKPFRPDALVRKVREVLNQTD